jgi:hypothetical protein
MAIMTFIGLKSFWAENNRTGARGSSPHLILKVEPFDLLKKPLAALIKQPREVLRHFLG